jgi:monothiol glutaredoxin
MSININELTKMLNESFPSSDVKVIDTVGDGNHLEATIISDSFSGKNSLQRHKMVYDSLGSIVGNEIHALALNTHTFAEKSGEAVSHGLQNKDQNINLSDDILKQIDTLVKDNEVVLFMKGNKDMPLCGFSSVVNHILLDLLQVNFVDVDVMADYKIRDKIKEYSNWPTIPQLYVKGQFIGGCDIVRGMFQNGELQELFKSQGINFTTTE